MRSKISIRWPWVFASLVMCAFIWGNSLVPGMQSGEASHAVLDLVHGALQMVGLPYEWMTNFVIRKIGHFTEYALLGVCVSQALDGLGTCDRRAMLASAAVLALVPSIDETIQLFVSGRAGMVSDVLLDCMGAAFGVAMRCLVRRLGKRGSARS